MAAEWSIQGKIQDRQDRETRGELPGVAADTARLVNGVLVIGSRGESACLEPDAIDHGPQLEQLRHVELGLTRFGGHPRSVESA